MGGMSQNVPGETQQQKQARLAQIQVPPDIAQIPMGPNNYRRLINQGSTPEQARNIVLKGSHAGQRDASQGNINEARKWEQFRNPACPPDRPYSPDPNHWKNAGMPWMDGTPPQDACLEKPQDWDKDTISKGYQTPQGWNQGTGQQGQGGQGQQQPQATGQNAGVNGNFQPQDPLQQRLMQMVGGGQGFFGENPMNNAASLRGGGVWWGQGGDFSQKFNPLAPQRSAGGGGGGQNPFQPPVQTQGQGSLQPFGQTESAPFGQTQNTPFVNTPQQPGNLPVGNTGFGTGGRSNMNRRLMDFYGGKVQQL